MRSPPPDPPRTMLGALGRADEAALVDEALGLRNEQVLARVVHYKAELETSPELDAITEQVATQLRELQARVAVARPSRPAADPRDALARSLAASLRRVVRVDGPSAAVERRLDARDEALRAFFARGTPASATRLVRALRASLAEMLRDELAAGLDTLAAAVVEGAGGAAEFRADYKIERDGFGAFRDTFERELLRRLVAHVRNRLVPALARGGVTADELATFDDPRLFGELCGALSDAVYEALHADGFLDLPDGWRVEIARRRA